MHISPQRTFRECTALLAALVLGVGLCAVNVQAQARKPYTKDAILGMLKGEVAPQRVAVLARQRGIDFEITPEVERELRQAGATAALLATLREVAPKPPAPIIKPTPVVPPPEGIKPGTVRLNSKDGLKYVWIPPGTFMMGCSPGDTECYDEEKPSHRVTITKGFSIGQTPVTVGAYKRFSSESGHAMPTAPDFNSGWSNEQMPVVSVRSDDAQAYAAGREDGCRLRRSGSMPREEQALRLGMATSMPSHGTTRTAVAGLTMWARNAPMDSDCLTS